MSGGDNVLLKPDLYRFSVPPRTKVFDMADECIDASFGSDFVTKRCGISADRGHTIS